MTIPIHRAATSLRWRAISFIKPLAVTAACASMMAGVIYAADLASPTPVPVVLENRPVPVSLPFGIWIGLIILVSAGLGGFGVIINSWVKLSRVTTFVTSLPKRIKRIERILRLVTQKLEIEIPDDEEDSEL